MHCSANCRKLGGSLEGYGKNLMGKTKSPGQSVKFRVSVDMGYLVRLTRTGIQGDPFGRIVAS